MNFKRRSTMYKYNREVELMTLRAEAKNQESETITRKPTPEELVTFQAALEKAAKERKKKNGNYHS